MARILIQEDDVMLRAEWSAALEQRGHTVLQTETATETIQAVIDKPAELYIIDMLAKRDGHLVPDGGTSVIPQIKGPTFASMRLRAASRTPLIAVSGSGNQRVRRDFLSLAQTLGADDTLMKPFTVDELLDTVDQLLGEYTQSLAKETDTE